MKIGILLIQRINNYGSLLQSYALSFRAMMTGSSLVC